MAALSHSSASEMSSPPTECISELSSDSQRTVPYNGTASAATATPSVTGVHDSIPRNTPTIEATAESTNQLLQTEVDHDAQSAKRPRPVTIRPAGGPGMPYAHLAFVRQSGNLQNFTIVGKCPHPDCIHTRIDRSLFQGVEYQWVSFEEGWAIGKESSNEELDLLPAPCRFQYVEYKSKGEPPFRGKFNISMV